MNNEYNITQSIKRIEDELMASMIRNLRNHRAEEIAEGYNWEQWQVKQLEALERYKKRNAKKYGNEFKDINQQIGALLTLARQEGDMTQEIKILNAIKNGFKADRVSPELAASFFLTNDRKLEALINATVSDMGRAETAILRMANDKYRRIIFDAQMYANSGAGTYEKAVDMATLDMRRAGLNCVEYKNGARHTLSDYADMAIRTASKRAYLYGEGEKRQEWGIGTVIMVKRGNPCPKCAPFVGRVLIDDVWSGGKPDGKHKLMSDAIKAGLYHPRCKDSHTTYFEWITEEDPYTDEERDELEEEYNQEQKDNYYKRKAEQEERMGALALDADNKEMHERRSTACAIHIDESGSNQRVKPEEPSVENANNIASEAIIEQYDHRIKDLHVNYVPSSEWTEDQKKAVADFAGMDAKLAEATARQFKNLSAEYNSMCQKIDVVKFESMMSSAPASTSPQMHIQQATISFNKGIVNNYDSFMERMRKAVSNGQFPMMPESEYEKYVITHEFAHTLMDFESPLKNYVGAETKHIRDARKEIRNIREEYNERIRELTIAQKKAELEALTSFNENDWKKAGVLTEKLNEIRISKYADMSIDEFMAEAFTDAKIGSSPSEYSKRVLDVIEKHFKKDTLENVGKSSKIESTIVKDAIDSGSVSKTINANKQNRHIKDSGGYIEGRSYIKGNIEDAQKLVDDLSGTGIPIIDSKGNWTNKERVEASETLGVHISPDDNKETETKKATIVYSKTGSHIIPRKDE